MNPGTIIGITTVILTVVLFVVQQLINKRIRDTIEVINK